MEASVPVCRVTDFMSHLFCDMLPHFAPLEVPRKRNRSSSSG